MVVYTWSTEPVDRQLRPPVERGTDLPLEKVVEHHVSAQDITCVCVIPETSSYVKAELLSSKLSSDCEK